MIQLVAYMIAAYGIARLLQTSDIFEKSGRQLAGVFGVGVLILLAILVTNQADAIGDLASNF